jgi:TonB family protein
MPPSDLQEPPVRRPSLAAPEEAGPPTPPDRWQRRLAWGILASVAVNAALWPIAAQVVRSHVLAPPLPITFRRIILPPQPKTPPHKKIVRPIHKPKPPPVIKHKPIIRQKPIIHHTPIVHPKPVPVRRPPVTPPQPPRRPPPPAAHQRIVTAKGPTAATHTALPGGHAPLGQPTEHQNVGEGHDVNQPPTPQPVPTPQPEAPTPQPPAPTPPPPVHQTPPPAPPAPKPPPPPPAPVGPTRDAQPANQTMPEIPDELKSEDYQSHVRVKVEISADGSFSATLLTSSGNEEIDQRVLDALKRWKWKPALQNGQPVASTARFRFDFDVQ